MPYGEPSHGWWCNARTYPTRCKHCGAKVFYFTCDCGSKVFFDKLDWPWPIHDCVGQILAQVEIVVREQYARKIDSRREWQAPISRCEARAGETIDDIGIVREICLVNVYKKLNIPKDSHIGAQMLGPLGRGDYEQITVHVEDLGCDTILSYTFWVECKKWDKLGAVRGELVSFRLTGFAVPGRNPVWLCEELESVQ